MPTPRGNWIWIDCSPSHAAANATQTVARPVPVAGVIKAARMVAKTIGAAASESFTLSKGTVNIMSAASVDLQADCTAGTVKALTLTTNASALDVLTTDYINVVYTLTTCAVTSAIGLWVAVEPEEW